MASNPAPDFPDFPPKHIRHCVYFEFSKGSTPQQAAKKINETYGQETANVKQCSQWFDRFRAGDTSMGDQGISLSTTSARPVQTQVEDMLKLLSSNSRVSSKKMAQQLGVSHDTILRNLRELGYKAKRGQWTPDTRRKNIATRKTQK
ncbi:unnamed protein product, partial [Mesorhabditis belari]|uniref:Mos1 transposase HTH domain-containing protein n=1 Tax=Mesorhabditis belari TaxID=2138241 RepID=A0AAF3EMY5_9BILA